MDTRQVLAVPATPAAFSPYGTLITMDHPAPEGSLDLSQGTPRLWVMPLYDVGLSFSSITRHRRVTQCLASATGHHWFLGVAEPGSDPAADPDAITVFRIPGGAFVQLAVGTWHAGPYFEPPRMRFYNLELSDTNEQDHDTVALPMSFTIDPDPTGEFRRRRVLVVANRTSDSPELHAAIRRLVATGVTDFHIVVPMAGTGVGALATAWDPFTALPPVAAIESTQDPVATREHAQQRLDSLVDEITQMGGDASGVVGESDPLAAVAAVLAVTPVDEIVLSTLPAGISRWLSRDLPTRCARRFGLPVTHVEAQVHQAES